MPQIKAVLGHVSVEIAARKRSCGRHRKGRHTHDIIKGESCLVIKTGDGTRANYCLESAIEILDRAEADLAEIRTKLGV